MSWLKGFEGELLKRGVTGRRHRRIVLELQDHINCAAGCEDRLGDPRLLAIQFADELAADETRGASFIAIGALAITAVAVLALHFVVGTGVRATDIERGHSMLMFWPAVIGILVGPQAALVAGMLAALRVLRRRRIRVLPAEEISLIRRRMWVALAAGVATVVGLELYVGDFSAVISAWRLELVGGVAGIAALALIGSATVLLRASLIVTHASGSAGDVFDDLPDIGIHGLRRHPWVLGGAVSVAVALAMTLCEWQAEHSLIEGLQRGALEGIAAAIGFALLGRIIGITTPSRQDVPMPTSH